jgi:hypothetical protein
MCSLAAGGHMMGGDDDGGDTSPSEKDMGPRESLIQSRSPCGHGPATCWRRRLSAVRWDDDGGDTSPSEKDMGPRESLIQSRSPCGHGPATCWRRRLSAVRCPHSHVAGGRGLQSFFCAWPAGIRRLMPPTDAIRGCDAMILMMRCVAPLIPCVKTSPLTPRCTGRWSGPSSSRGQAVRSCAQVRTGRYFFVPIAFHQWWLRSMWVVL